MQSHLLPPWAGNIPDPRRPWSRVHCTRRQPPPCLCGDPSPTGDMCERHVCFSVCGVCLCGHVTPDPWRRWASHCKLGLRGVPPTHRVLSSAVCPREAGEGGASPLSSQNKPSSWCGQDAQGRVAGSQNMLYIPVPGLRGHLKSEVASRCEDNRGEFTCSELLPVIWVSFYTSLPPGSPP